MFTNTQNHYEILGVQKTATTKEIKKAYKALVLLCHPDKNPGNLETEEKFKKISQAYTILSNVDSRRNYDFGSEIEFNIIPNHVNSSVFFDIIFGNIFNKTFSRGGSSSFKFKPPDLVYHLDCSLSDIFNGVVKKMEYRRKVNGTEQIDYIDVEVPKDCFNGQQLKFSAKGTIIENCYPGNLLVVLHEKNNNKFLMRNNYDLVYIHVISLKEALIGIKISLLNLDNERFFFDMRNEVITEETEKRIVGKGFDSQGDLIIKFKINFPKELSSEQKESIEKIL